MPKVKTHRGAAKLFKVTVTGKIRRRKAFRSHLLEKKSSRRTRRLGRDAEVSLWSLRLPAKEIGRAMRLIEWLGRPEVSPARALGALGPEDASALLQMRGEDGAALARLIETDACVTIAQLAVDGRDLTALGISGPAVGRTLERLLNEVIDGAPNDRAALLSRALND